MSRGTKKEGSSSYVGFSPKSRVPSPILQKKKTTSVYGPTRLVLPPQLTEQKKRAKRAPAGRSTLNNFEK